MPDKFLVTFEGRREEDDVPVGKAIAEVEFIVASVDDVEVETFDIRCTFAATWTVPTLRKF